MSAHGWILAAPWYRRAGAAPGATATAIQAYDTSRLVDVFLANPQRCLRRTDAELRLVHAVQGRFYLVVCELHCDRLGFPSAGTDDVCQAGFVVRRRRVPPAAELAREAASARQRLAARGAQIAALEHGAGAGAIALAPARRLAIRQARDERRLAELVRADPVLEGWAPSDERRGMWSRIEGDAPLDGDELTHPLYPLTADPRVASHAAYGRALYFGVVPTAGAETDPDGAPRLDASSDYELRCFVRRHDPRCPRTRGPARDCHGELTWSLPSEPFALASAQEPAVFDRMPARADELPNPRAAA